MNHSIQSVAPGIWRLRFSQPETATPVSLRRSQILGEALSALPDAGGVPPISIEACGFSSGDRGCRVTLPFDSQEGIFGLGLQLKSHLQSGKKKLLRVNSDPVSDTGDSHAPVPFYVSSTGYGVLIDSARYVSVYVGTHVHKSELRNRVVAKKEAPALSTTELYRGQAFGKEVVIDIPAARGVDIYLFAGPDMLTAVQRYNLFSGGGCLPPLWGLGNWYRACARHDAGEVLQLADAFQKDRLSFSVLGLEPGWQTQAYPCSFVWSERFPAPGEFIATLNKMGYRLNLWEHAFTHDEAPFATEITPYCAEYLAMDGLVPDFIHPQGAQIFTAHHRTLAESGVSGFKLDECDNSDYISFSWSFPEHGSFPSGIDGEQAHCLYGIHYQYAVDGAFTALGRRSYGQVRSSGALAAPLPNALYSDLYDHADFIRGVVNAGFCGLLWSPEVRHAQSVEDLVRRLQTTVLSPLSQVNGWYIPMPPWHQVNRSLNEKKIHMEGSAEAVAYVRAALDLRTQLLPVLYTAFAKYASDGTPPFRALSLDYPADKEAWGQDQQFMIGESLLAAPLKAGERQKRIYLPEGVWYDFFDGKRYEGGQYLVLEDPALDLIPLFVKSGAILPLADIAPAGADAVLRIRPHVYATDFAAGILYEDAGDGFGYRSGQCGYHQLSWQAGSGLCASWNGDTAIKGKLYQLADIVIKTQQ